MGFIDPSIVALGYRDFVHKFGRATVGSTKQIVWTGTPSVYNCLDETANELFSVISTDDEDKVGGGGATHIQFIYQQLDGVEYQSPEIELNGTTAVDIPDITGVISYRMVVTKSENEDILTGPNHGVIKLYQTGTATKIYAEIAIAEGQTLMGIYRIPSNKYAELLSLFLDGSSGKTATIWLKVRTDRNSAWQTKATRSIYESAVDDVLVNPAFIAPGSDVVLMGLGSGAGTLIDAQFELKLYNMPTD